MDSHSHHVVSLWQSLSHEPLESLDRKVSNALCAKSACGGSSVWANKIEIAGGDKTCEAQLAVRHAEYLHFYWSRY